MAKTEWYSRTSDTVEHIGYIDKKAKELEHLLAGSKTMIVRGAAGKKSPHGRVKIGETVYLVETGSGSIITAKAIVKSVINTEKLTPEESKNLVDHYMDKLQLTPIQYETIIGKKVLCFIEFEQVEKVQPFTYDRTNNMDNWIIIDDINKIKIKTQYTF